MVLKKHDISCRFLFEIKYFIHLTDDSLVEDLRDTIARGIVKKYLVEKV